MCQGNRLIFFGSTALITSVEVTLTFPTPSPPPEAPAAAPPVAANIPSFSHATWSQSGTGSELLLPDLAPYYRVRLTLEVSLVKDIAFYLLDGWYLSIDVNSGAGALV